MKKWENTVSKIIPVGFVLFLILIWDLVTQFGLIEQYILPSPRSVVKAFFEIFQELLPHIYVTMSEALIGLFISIVFAILLAMLMDYVKFIRLALYPLLIISQTVPTIVLAPLFAIWFGFGMLPKVIIVVLVCFFPMVISLMEGLDAIDQDQINLLKSMGANKYKIFKLVKLPAAMVSFFSGLKVAATYSVMGAFVGEWMGGRYGLGLYMLSARKSFQLDKVFVVIFVIVALSLIMFKVITLLQYILMPWERKRKSS